MEKRKPKIRRNWGNTKPWTKVKQSDTIYDRNKMKEIYKKELKGV